MTFLVVQILIVIAVAYGIVHTVLRKQYEIAVILGLLFLYGVYRAITFIKKIKNTRKRC